MIVEADGLELESADFFTREIEVGGIRVGWSSLSCDMRLRFAGGLGNSASLAEAESVSTDSDKLEELTSSGSFSLERGMVLKLALIKSKKWTPVGNIFRRFKLECGTCEAGDD